MDLKLNLQQFVKYLAESLNNMHLSQNCKDAINANAVSIFNKANTTLQTDGSEEVLDTFELQAAKKDVDEYVETYNKSLLQYDKAIAEQRAKYHTMFKDYEFEGHGLFPDWFSITVNNEKMVVGDVIDGSGRILLVRGDASTNFVTPEYYNTLEDLISQINNPDNNFGKLGYKGLDLNDVEIGEE